MTKKLSLDEVLEQLREQAATQWSQLDGDYVIGGAAPAPAQAECHAPTKP